MGWITEMSRVRCIFGGATALAGLVVSIAIANGDWSMVRHLPGWPFHIAAIAGAGLAGVMFFNAFGRAGQTGWIISLFAAALMTVVGGVSGAQLLTMAAGAFHGDTIFNAGGILGLIVILDSATSLLVVCVWLLAMAALHRLARRLRGGWLPPRIRLPAKP